MRHTPLDNRILMRYIQRADAENAAGREKLGLPDMKKSGAAGVIRRGDGIQVVYGPQVSVIKSELEEHIDRLEAQD